MIESLNKYRAKFPDTGDQQKWIELIRKSLHISVIASICLCSERTIRDWQREKFLMNYESLVLLCKSLHITVPLVNKIDKYTHTSMAGKKGGKNLIKKYGKVPVNELERKKAWQKWWTEVGVNKMIKILQPKAIKIPCKGNLLAEYVGIVLGDGNISKYRVAITLNSVNDLKYSRFVRELTKKLFNVKPKAYYRKAMRVVDIVVARTQLVDYLVKLGLKIGHKVKHQVSIPEWIMLNTNYSLACVRGLMDTDGSFFTHTYTAGGKSYAYKKITFSSASSPLRRDVLKILSSAGIKAHCTDTNVRIDAMKDVLEYVKLIGTNNPKHLKRYIK